MKIDGMMCGMCESHVNYAVRRVFPDKAAAYRVLKKGGVFCGCFYIKWESRQTDWFINKLNTLKGFFTPPYETADSMRSRLGELYTQSAVKTEESMASLVCRK